MSDDPGFEPRPRRETVSATSFDRANFRAELQRIQRRIDAVTATDRKDFAEGHPSYDVASMIIIRLAALLERTEFHDATQQLTLDEIAAIKTTRNIVAHAGYRGMNDDLFWAAVTVRVPKMLARLLEWGKG
ncbi:antitoxin [Gulosibacter macacae]|uniref:Antitoxin n=1 Tax=Gulosibacter macacae TaxID=2488791 RepID=A0A3P3VVE7_9MICO|nr:antitoxin [Gulosibacter macacae]